MWPLPAIEHELITFCFSSDSIACSWIHKVDDAQCAQLKAYQRTPLEHLELEKLILFNPTHIKNIITDFLSRYKKQNAFIAWSFSGETIQEEYVTLPIPSPKKEDFGINHSHNILWQYEYLYQNNDGHYVFYVYKLPRSLLLQYKLLAIASSCNVILMTTITSALLQCYKHTYKNSDLALDMTKHNNNPRDMISPQDLQKMLSTPSTVQYTEEMPYLAASYGLFVNQGINL